MIPSPKIKNSKDLMKDLLKDLARLRK